MKRRADADAMHVPGLHALLRSDGSDEPVETTAVALTLAEIDLPPLTQWIVDRSFARCAKLSVSADDTITVIEPHPPVRPAWFDEEDDERA